MKIVEFRGVKGLVYAEVTADTAENFATGTVKQLAGVAEIQRTTESSNESHYYDNIPAVVVSSTGADELTVTASAIDLETLADITGQVYDQVTGMFVEQERTPKYFAIGYETEDTDGNSRYVWRLKGMFSVPDETHSTINDGTDANGQELTYTGVSTIHEFTKTGASAKAVVVDTSINNVPASTFFGAVQTPDTIAPAPAVSGIGVAPSSITIAVDEEAQLEATLYPAGATGTVTWAVTSGGTYASVTSAGVVKGLAEGSATVTATCSGKTDTCSVTVSNS